MPAWTDSGLVFTSSVGMVIEPRNLSRLFDELIEAARVRRIRFHDLRHTCASRPRSAVLSKRLPIRGNSLERMTGIEPALSAWEAGETTSQVVFQAQIWPFEGLLLWLFRRVGACGGPGHLIKMASADVADDMRTQRLPLGA